MTNSSEHSKDLSPHVTNEVVNTVSHLAAACVALLGAALLIAQVSAKANPWNIVGVSIYGLSLVSLFVFSTLHHGVTGSPRVNEVLRTFDYAAVFVLIAGTVTPLVLIRYRSVYGWTVLGTIWAIAAIGITLRAVRPHLPKHITNTLYIVLGWLPTALMAATPKLSTGSLLLLAAGGLVYSLGFIVYVVEKPNFKPGFFGFHELWHCLVVIAAALQYFCIYRSVLL